MFATLAETPEQEMSVREFLALPDDKSVDRMLIRGCIWEKPFVLHDRWRASCQAAIGTLVQNWVESQSKSRGTVFSGGGFILRKSPGSVVGIDIAYASHEVVARDHENSGLINGPPVLAVEILACDDTQEDVIARVHEYLNVGVPLIWVVEPAMFRTVTVYRPNQHPSLLSGTSILSGGDQMPRFQITVNDIFED